VFERVGVVGSGIMASGIAEVAAAHGHDVVLRARSQDAADSARTTVEASLARQVEKGRCTEEAAKETLTNLTFTADLADVSDVDVVIESVVEDLSVKKHLVAALADMCHERTVIATNTSTLPVVELAMATGRADKVCGIHFFNPAHTMPLVEVVRPITASDDTIAAAVSFAKACGKEPVEVLDRAGFVVNALLFPYLNEAVRLLELGVATKDGIDIAMKGGCGFPMGPFALLDLVGLDTAVAILDALYAEHREQHMTAAPTLRRMVAAGKLGRKSGEGFYRYR